MKENKKVILDFYLKMHQEQLIQIRHYETQRSTVVSTIIAISGALIGIITFDDNIDNNDVHLVIFLFLIGSFGVAFLTKHSKRLGKQKDLAKEQKISLYNLIKGEEATYKFEKDELSNTDLISMRYWWIGMIIAIVLLGVAIAIQISFFQK